MRKLIRLLAVAGLTASSLMLVGPGSSGPAGALPPDDTEATCAILGTVTTNFLTYGFVQSELTCAGTFEGGDPDVAVYLVVALGLSQSLTVELAMEDCSAGRLHGAGTLHAHKMSGGPGWPLLLLGTVHFKRVASTVIAWGLLHNDAHTLLTAHWYGEFEFTPKTQQDLENCEAGTPPVNANLTGTAQVSSLALVPMESVPLLP